MYIPGFFRQYSDRTWGGGINFISSKPPFVHHVKLFSDSKTMKQLKQQSSQQSLYDRDKDGVWIGTDGGGINVFEGEKRIAIFIEKRVGIFSFEFLIASFTRFKRNLWFGSYQGGISYYDSRIKDSVPSPHGTI